ncbi:MAG: glycosyltransferase family 1 protein [Dysgonamonadaceae bacterium]
MKIAIDGNPFTMSYTGVAKYLLSLIRLVTSIPNCDVYIICNKDFSIPEDLNVIKIVDKEIFSNLNFTVWLKTRGSFFISKFAFDYYWSCSGIQPYLTSKTKYISVIHDLNYKIVPSMMGTLQFFTHLVFMKQDARRTDYIITNSQGSADKIFSYLGCKVQSIINPPTDKHFKKIDDKNVKTILDKYNIHYSYFLTVGTLEPRKNLRHTINVYNSLSEDVKAKYKLVIVGTSGWKNKTILDLCESNKENVIRLGYIEEHDLPYIYNGASIFLFPSIYEGFGMPVREAVHCGIEVITSNIPETIEACYGQGRFIQPNDSAEYKKTILEVIHATKSSEQKQIDLYKKEADLQSAQFLKQFQSWLNI